MTNHPDQLRCEALFKAGWEWETEKIYARPNQYEYGFRCISTDSRHDEDVFEWLPCPSIGELLEQLSDDEIIRYIFAHNDMECLMGATLMKMVLKEIRDPNVLADIWPWTQKEKQNANL